MGRSQMGGIRRAYMADKLRGTVSGNENIDSKIEE